MSCPTCKRPIVGERNYCGGCGAPLARYCTRCGFRNQVADRFCGGCGCAVDAAAPGAFAEGPPDMSVPVPRPPTAPPASPGGDDLAELLAAAKEGAAPKPEDPSARVSQDDIDSLFGD